MNKRLFSKSLLLVLVSFVLLSSALCGAEPAKIKIFTSILPQKYIVEQIAGDLVEVEVLVGPGVSPHTFEPTPQQMSRLSRAVIFFLVGVPFERALVTRLTAICPGLKIVNTDKNVPRRSMDSLENGHEHSDDCGHESGAPDPHFWLDPLLVVIQAENMAIALREALPDYKARIDDGLQKLVNELRDLDAELAAKLMPINGEAMLVFHPAFGYFADRYGLKQQAVELEGKEPGPRRLAELIRYCRQNSIHVIFVQKQFPVAAAKTIARSIDGAVVLIDPLAEDYFANLRELAGSVLVGAKQK
ncbi:MAG: zinc ABC transporter substrate-binding protein [Candidatus Riflebacteria bacterium]|nr:zinc ABC transporter substrate-binding protein [Candidatus Riflebacteria bacterium]